MCLLCPLTVPIANDIGLQWLVKPIPAYVVNLLRPFLLSLSLNTLIAPVLHLLTLLPDHPLLPLFKGDVALQGPAAAAAHTALLPSVVTVHVLALILQAAGILV